MDARFVLMAHVSSHVEEALLAKGIKEDVEEARAAGEAHIAHGEEHQTDESAAVVKIKLEGNGRLKHRGWHFQMHHAQRVPIAHKKRRTLIQRTHPEAPP